ncbi:hypothetical protein INR49_026732 [Caranx melampygus]|nr:hypothetical protein INR49_026732 [Caranx melampygus]
MKGEEKGENTTQQNRDEITVLVNAEWEDDPEQDEENSWCPPSSLHLFSSPKLFFFAESGLGIGDYVQVFAATDLQVIDCSLHLLCQIQLRKGEGNERLNASEVTDPCSTGTTTDHKPQGNRLTFRAEAAKDQSVHPAAGQVHFEEILLLRRVRLSPGFELPFPKTAPGCETFRVGPAYLLAAQAQVSHCVLHHQVGRKRSVPVPIVDYPPVATVADLKQAVLADLALVQMNDLVVLLVDGPVGGLRGGHELQQVPRFAHSQQSFGRVHVQVLVLPQLGEDAFLGAERGVFHLIDREGSLLGRAVVLGEAAVRRSAVVHLLLFVREEVGDADPKLVLLQPGRIPRGQLAVVEMVLR